MLSSPYDILELFELAFDRVRVLGEIIQIDCSEKMHYAEGKTKGGIQWRIEADVFTRTFQNQDQLQQGYAHLG